jgi:hypothetical protein
MAGQIIESCTLDKIENECLSEQLDIIKDECLFDEFLIFYYLCRFKQKISGSICGAVDGCLTGYYIGMKWGGGGGWIVGGLSQIVGMIIPGIAGFFGGLIEGLFLDRKNLIKVTNDYRLHFGQGGIPPTHGSLS